MPLNIVVVNSTMRDMPDVAVRQTSRELSPAELASAWFRRLVEDLFEALYATPGGIGLAAPQVGVLLKVAVISLRDGTSPLVLANPSYEGAEELVELQDERCLSVPDFAAPVPRYRSIRVRYQDQQGRLVARTEEEFLARVMQHEIDHLNGILCIDRTTDRALIRAESGGYAARRAQTTTSELFETSSPIQ